MIPTGFNKDMKTILPSTSNFSIFGYLFFTLTSVSIIIGVVIVCLTSPKPPDKVCKFIVKSEARSSITIDSYPRSIVVADFNNDDRLDMVVPNSGTNCIGVFMGDTNDTWK
ncbi:unnamed protein product, partial [Adineta ricciae]